MVFVFCFLEISGGIWFANLLQTKNKSNCACKGSKRSVEISLHLLQVQLCLPLDESFPSFVQHDLSPLKVVSLRTQTPSWLKGKHGPTLQSMCGYFH